MRRSMISASRANVDTSIDTQTAHPGRGGPFVFSGLLLQVKRQLRPSAQPVFSAIRDHEVTAGLPWISIQIPLGEQRIYVRLGIRRFYSQKQCNLSRCRGSAMTIDVYRHIPQGLFLAWW